MKKFKKLILILLSVLFVLGVFSGCGEEKSFAWGFTEKLRLFGHEWRIPSHCGVSGDSRTFDNENVTFDLHYGSQVVRDEAELDEFYISVYDEDKNEYRLKTIQENILSEKYLLNIEKKGRKNIYRFSHSEPITIPPEVFDGGESFEIAVWCYPPKRVEETYEEEDKENTGHYVYITCSIKYKVNGEKVIFTGYEPKYYK